MGSAATQQGGGLPGGKAVLIYGSLGSSKSKPGTMMVLGYSVGALPYTSIIDFVLTWSNLMKY